MWRDDAYLLDMLLSARKILEYTAGVDIEGFHANEMMQDAVMRLVQLVGEAARKISDEFRNSHPEIPWAGIIGMRNRLVHEYFRIIPGRVWDVVQKDIPELVRSIEPLVPDEE